MSFRQISRRNEVTYLMNLLNERRCFVLILGFFSDQREMIFTEVLRFDFIFNGECCYKSHRFVLYCSKKKEKRSSGVLFIFIVMNFGFL